MATAPTRTRRAPRDRWIEMSVDWKGYTAILRARGDHGVPRMIYLDGSLLLVSPAEPHERLKKRLGMFVDEVVIGLRIPFLPKGQTTFRRQSKKGGVEGDEAYYITNVERVRGKIIDLEVDPPPDLAIEVVHTHPVSKALATYGRLGVPEVWVGEEGEVRILVRQPNGRYAPSSNSLALPFLTAVEIADWATRSYTGDETEWALELRRWVAETLAPRLRPPND